ncbi:MAG: class I SAM-dependent methyltransferase [Thermoplasmata archaeon]
MESNVEFYERSARYYDLIYGSIVDYEREGTLLEEVFQRYAERPIRRVLDLGSGTGNHALVLASRGYDVLGIDRSEAFVAVAREKARERPAGPRFVVGDMRELSMEDQFDAIISMFGAFGHVPRGEAGDALRRFRHRLEPGGILAFEWWNEPGTRDGYQDWLEREGEGIRLIRMGKSRVDREAHTLEITLKHVVLRGDRLDDTFTERALMALYEVEVMEGLLSHAGLTPVAMLDWTRKTLEPSRPDDLRALAVARRDP